MPRPWQNWSSLATWYLSEIHLGIRFQHSFWIGFENGSCFLTLACTVALSFTCKQLAVGDHHWFDWVDVAWGWKGGKTRGPILAVTWWNRMLFKKEGKLRERAERWESVICYLWYIFRGEDIQTTGEDLSRHHIPITIARVWTAPTSSPRTQHGERKSGPKTYLIALDYSQKPCAGVFQVLIWHLCWRFPCLHKARTSLTTAHGRCRHENLNSRRKQASILSSLTWHTQDIVANHYCQPGVTRLTIKMSVFKDSVIIV